ncbi:hypothetical protein FACS189485_04290 [Spirochaetia bacterium]|nr:hypothetical protein FACS189485_04290 [Spirochaetia bacterium]
MKKNLLLPVIAGALLTALFLSGCASVTTDKGVFDPSIDEDRQSYLEVHNGMSVTQFDETFVNWSPDGLFSGTTLVTIPAGAHAFQGTYTVTTTNNGFSNTRTIHFSLDTKDLKAGECLPGHTYKIYQQKIWVIFFTITNIKIKDITPGKVLKSLEA